MNDTNVGIIELALETEKQRLCFIKTNLPMEELMACENEEIIKALEKQIPKKPLEIKERYNFRGDVICKGGYCPMCKNELSNAYFYCNKCGQAIDWGNKDE